MPSPGDIAYRPINPPTIGRNGWQGFNPHTSYLKKGDKPFGYRQVDCDITIEHDVEIVARDGIKLYVDVYRPTNVKAQIPAILSYSPFGKKYSGMLM
jgi:predicted acyl esterase